MTARARIWLAALGQGVATGLISTVLYMAALVGLVDEAFTWRTASLFFSSMFIAGVVSSLVSRARSTSNRARACSTGESSEPAGG